MSLQSLPIYIQEIGTHCLSVWTLPCVETDSICGEISNLLMLKNVNSFMVVQYFLSITGFLQILNANNLVNFYFSVRTTKITIIAKRLLKLSKEDVTIYLFEVMLWIYSDLRFIRYYLSYKFQILIYLVSSQAEYFIITLHN